MNSFLTELDLTPLSDGRNWQLVKPLVYCADMASDGDTLVIPTGFTTDLASVPRLLWNIFPPFGTYTKAAVIHDYGYRHGGVYPGAKFIYSKSQVDKLFLAAMASSGTGWFTRTVLYTAVKYFGRCAFKVQ